MAQNGGFTPDQSTVFVKFAQKLDTVASSFYNGALSTLQRRRLRAVARAAGQAEPGRRRRRAKRQRRRLRQRTQRLLPQAAKLPREDDRRSHVP